QLLREPEAALQVLEPSLPRHLECFGPSHHAVREVRWLIGLTLRRLERYDEAAEVLETALTDAAKDPDHQPFLRANLELELARVEDRRGHEDRALELYRAATETRARHLGPTHRDTLIARRFWARQLSDQQRIDECIEQYRILCDGWRECRPRAPGDWAKSDLEFAEVLRKAKQLDEALARLVPWTVPGSESAPAGEIDADEQDAIGVALSWIQRDRGDHDAALRTCEALESLRRSRYGPDDDETQQAALWVAISLRRVERWSDAIARLAPIVQRRRETAGANDEQFRSALLNLALAEDGAGSEADAIAAYEELVALERADDPRDADDFARHLDRLADLYRDRDQLEKALELRVEQVAVSRAAHGPSTRLLRPLYDLGRNQLDLGRWDDAKRTLTESVELHRELRGEHSLGLLLSLRRLAEARVELGDFEGAERDALAAYRGLEATRDPGDRYLRGARNLLATLYRRWGRAEEAAKWEAEP
ncbi:MAG: tetratricopeptide repeat protein, partial [Planctomycetes bacterium]|nr:tetratricopeptide repeat protein [Planctomycetota bacterium]